jgi:calpain-15
MPFSRHEQHLPWTICDSPEPRDIRQGEVGDCWLMTALALITERPRMLQHILLTKTVNKEGVYVVRVCHNGLWKAVVVDDYFPCTKHDRFAYSQASRRQLYVPLIEKACAKLFGSYATLDGGSTAEGLQMLTGAACYRIDMSPMNGVLDFNVIWAKLLSACESK